MRIYKFRGKTFETKEYLYGDLIQGDNGVYIKLWGTGVEVEVDNDTIAQFVGYDRKGREVYEGDALRNPTDGTTFKAAMNHIYVVGNYELITQGACPLYEK